MILTLRPLGTNPLTFDQRVRCFLGNRALCQSDQSHYKFSQLTNAMGQGAEFELYALSYLIGQRHAKCGGRI